jgi:hypothetical protein
MKKKEDFNPNATIQLDQVDADEVVFNDPGFAARPPQSRPPQSRRTAPPPLPPSTFPPSSIAPHVARPSEAPAPPPRSTARVLAYGVGFVLMLAVAIFAGARFGLRARRMNAAAIPSASAVPAAPAPPASSAPSKAASEPIMTIPTVEIR